MVKKKQQNKSSERLRLESIMAQCYGTINYWKEPLLLFKYTDGVKTFADNAGAYWFLYEVNRLLVDSDRIVSYKLVVNDGKVDILRDGEKVRKISYTDCPEGEWEFFYSPFDKVFMWNMEY